MRAYFFVFAKFTTLLNTWTQSFALQVKHTNLATTNSTSPRKSATSTHSTMNAAMPIRVARRATSSICLSCRRTRVRQFTSSTCLTVAEFQSYRLNPQPLTPPRSAGGPDTSITHPIEPPMPRVHETRPPKTVPSTTTSIREEVAQQSQAAFAHQSQEQQAQSQPSPTPTKETLAPTTTAAATSSQQEAAAAAAPPKARPRSKLRAPRKAAMKLTPAAVEQLRALLDQPEPKLIKVGVRNRGCSGLAYHLEYVDKAGAFDETVEQDGVKVLIDSKALFSIIGSEMDWQEDKLNERFVFRNPNISECRPAEERREKWLGGVANFLAEEQCGCGESFMV